jgi:hypothetical protein
MRESDLNDPRLITPRAAGYGLTAQWSDDFHHALYVSLTGDTSGTTPTSTPSIPGQGDRNGFFHDWTPAEASAVRESRPSVSTPLAHAHLRLGFGPAPTTTTRIGQPGRRRGGCRPRGSPAAVPVRRALDPVDSAPSPPMIFMVRGVGGPQRRGCSFSARIQNPDLGRNWWYAPVSGLEEYQPRWTGTSPARCPTRRTPGTPFRPVQARLVGARNGPDQPGPAAATSCPHQAAARSSDATYPGPDAIRRFDLARFTRHPNDEVRLAADRAQAGVHGIVVQLP